MTPELISKIFKPSFSEKKLDHQNHRGGFGLDLFTVMEITKRWGGWIQVDSKLGFGTEFWVWFPYHTEP
jgi:signal transduction histidine kinase